MAGENIQIRIVGTLDSTLTLSDINKKIKELESKVSKINLSVNLDDKTSKVLADFSKAMENHKKIAQDLNRVIREEKEVNKAADGTIREKIKQHLKSGEIIEKEIKRTNEKTKAIKEETEATGKLISEYDKLGQKQKQTTRMDGNGNVTGSSSKYKNGFTNTTLNADKDGKVTSVTNVKNLDQERQSTEILNSSKLKLKQTLNQLNTEGKVSAENLTKLNKAIDNSKNIQQVNKLEESLKNLNRIRENEFKIEQAKAQAQINAQRINTTHGGHVDNRGVQQYLDSINNLTPRTANLNQQLQRSATQFNQVAQNARTAAGATQQAGMSFGEMLSTAMTKFPIWMISATLFYAPLRAIEEMSNRLLQIDTQMTNIRRIMDMPEFKFTDLLNEAVATSDELSSKLTDVLDKIGSFGRMGFGEDQLIDISKTAQVLQNISDLDSSASVDTLTSAMLNFNIAAKDSVSIADQINEVDNNFAVSSKDISDGIRRSASTAKTFGVSLSDLIGYIAGIGSTTRETGSVIGNGLKTIFSRITTMSEAESALQSVNISIKDMGGNVKPVSNILSELAGKWTTLSDEQRQNLGVTLAGIMISACLFRNG